jgi:hypothetical protein
VHARFGYTVKTIWETLRDERKLAMSYQTFRTHRRRAGVALKSEASSSGCMHGTLKVRLIRRVRPRQMSTDGNALRSRPMPLPGPRE